VSSRFWNAVVWILMGFIVLLLIAIGYGNIRSQEDDSPIPLPPAGYEYCVQGDRVAFCTQEP
jgi:hypothetical protein